MRASVSAWAAALLALFGVLVGAAISGATGYYSVRAAYDAPADLERRQERREFRVAQRLVEGELSRIFDALDAAYSEIGTHVAGGPQEDDWRTHVLAPTELSDVEWVEHRAVLAESVAEGVWSALRDAYVQLRRLRDLGAPERPEHYQQELKETAALISGDQLAPIPVKGAIPALRGATLLED